VHGDSEIDRLSIAAAERILSEAGIDVADLIEVTEQPSGPVDNPNPGAA
jgi:hypothetical protein